MNNTRNIFIILFVLFVSTNLSATTITPNGKQVTIDSWGDTLSAEAIAAIDYIIENYYDVETVQSSQTDHGRFNCHFFAWNNTQGYGVWVFNEIWLNGQPAELGWDYNPNDYFTDGSYSVPSGYSSYVSTTSSDAEICVYTIEGEIEHSARTLANSSKLISKWGRWGIYKHDPDECPDERYHWSSYEGGGYTDYGDITAYYKINPLYKPVNDPGDRFDCIDDAINDAQSGCMVSVYPGSYSLTHNIIVPSGVTLYLQSGVEIDFDIYSITTSTGNIQIQSVILPDIRLMSGANINGLYPTINSAFSAGGVYIILCKLPFNQSSLYVLQRALQSDSVPLFS